MKQMNNFSKESIRITKTLRKRNKNKNEMKKFGKKSMQYFEEEDAIFQNLAKKKRRC